MDPFKPPTWKAQREARRRADKERMIAWHEAVCSRALHPGLGLYMCYHCERFFPREAVCGDHFPHSRGARPDLKYDPANGVCSCKPCNQSDSKTRRRSAGL